jgi:nucleoside-diphosphate-sugar epimerase
MRLLIIGASSYLGGHLRRQAAAAGFSVTTAGRSDLPGTHYRLDLVADGASRAVEVIAAAAPDVVVNCAGATTGDTDVLAAANITAVHTLVTAMLGRPVRLVHIASAAEYGGTGPGVSVTESDPVRPSSVYGVTKLAGTRLVELARTAGLDAVALRVFNVVGAGAPGDGLPGQAAAQFRRAMAVGTEVRLGPLDGVRDFVDARDVADAVLAAATVAALPHPVVNVGSGTGVPARVLVKELVAVSGYEGVVHEDAPGSARSPAMSFQQADITFARRDLSWKPRRDLAESVADLWHAARLAPR